MTDGNPENNKGKASRKPRGAAGNGGNVERFCPNRPWECRHHADRSEIVAYIEVAAAWETVAVIPPITGSSAKATAEFIARLVNDSARTQSLLREAMEALQLCLEEDTLTFASEQAADRVAAEIRKTGIVNKDYRKGDKYA